MKHLLWVLPALMLAGCDTSPPSADEHQQQVQAQTTAQGDREVGMPAIVNWAEKRQVKDLYELRDKMVPTWAYVQGGLDGRLICLGRAVGYGIPYAVQYSNPQSYVYQRPVWEGSASASETTTVGRGAIQKPQPEPNGLYMPTDAEGTWVQMLNPDTQKVEPVYVEPRVTISPFRLRGPSVAADCPSDKGAK